MLLLLFACLSLEDCATALINQFYLVFSHISKLHYVALGTFADSHNLVGFTTSIAKLPTIYHHVDRLVVFRMAQEYQVVNGNHALYSSLMYAHRQFASKTMIDIYMVAFQVVDDIAYSP